MGCATHEEKRSKKRPDMRFIILATIFAAFAVMAVLFAKAEAKSAPTREPVDCASSRVEYVGDTAATKDLGR